MDTFLRLPLTLCTDILSRWLTVCDWSLLDRCYVPCRDDRHEWFALLHADGLILQYPHTVASDQFMEWCAERYININRLIIRGSANDDETLERFVRTCCKFSSELHIYDEESLHRASEYALMTKANIKSVCVTNCESLLGLAVLLRCVGSTIEHLFINGITDEEASPTQFANIELPRLTRLELHDLPRASTGVLAGLLPHCTSLDRATFVDVEFDRKLMPALASIGKTLHTVALLSCSNLTDQDLDTLSRHCPLLEAFLLLELRGTFVLTDRAVASVTANCPKLTTLQLCTAVGQFTDASLGHIARNCGNRLLHLYLCGMACDNSDVGTFALARCCTNLRALCWTCTGVPDDALCTLFRSLPRLQELQYGGLTDAMIRSLADHCPDLTYLNTQGPKGPSFSTETLVHLLRRCASLRKLIALDSAQCAAVRREAERLGRAGLVATELMDEGCPALVFSV